MNIFGLYITTATQRKAELAKIARQKAEAETVRQSLVLTIEDNFKKHAEREHLRTAMISKLMDQNANLIGKVTALRGKGAVNLN